MPATMQEERTIPLSDGLVVTQSQDDGRVTLTVRAAANADCVLHWGLTRRPGSAWEQPPEESWPEGSSAVGAQALSTPFTVNHKGEREVTIQLATPCPWGHLVFVVFFPKERRWLKSGNSDFCVRLPEGCGPADPEEALSAWLPEGEIARRTITLTGGDRVAVAVRSTPEAVNVRLVSDAGAPLLMHWGLAWQFRFEWDLPPEGFRPAGTVVFDERTAHTPFEERDGLQYLELEFKRTADGRRPRGMKFVLFQPEQNRWLNGDGKDIFLPLFEQEGDLRLGSPLLRDLAEQIVGAERGASSWTLMHRFNLCHDLLGTAQDDEDALALLYVWLRYSATRQLDWQRRYNTKPRELSHAQDRLTARLGGVWRRHPGAEGASFRRWVRLMLTTLGRGGDGQRVRDEILHIMHRNYIKEASGHFIEEWHQKLHNNTTPDDVVICEAYLAFLRAGGDQAVFYKTLEAGGVTRERLRSFERPIKSEPTFYADKKNALIGEFENFLRVLKSVHAGTDLDSAVGAARGKLDGETNKRLDALDALRRGTPGSRELCAAITAARAALQKAVAGASDDGALRDLLFLDLALEELLRGTIERQNLSRCDRDKLVELNGAVLRNLVLSSDARELEICSGHWDKLSAAKREGREWALHAKSVADRGARWLQAFTDALYQRLQPKAEVLGKAFGAEPWVVSMFSEGVVRGLPGFALSLLHRQLDPMLRKAAGLGGWQIISPGRAAGRVRKVAHLRDVQTDNFPEAVVLVVDTVNGDEEIPAGVLAVVTADTPDLVSHVAVRARNAHVLFATCFDPDLYERLKGLEGKTVSLRVTPGGDVDVQEGTAAPAHANGVARAPVVDRVPKGSPLWVVTQDQFTPEVVGGKSRNLNGLRGRVPDWIHLPASLALPFDTFEKTLQDPANQALRRDYERLIAAAEHLPGEALDRVRNLLTGLTPPAALKDALLSAWHGAKLSDEPWDHAWNAIQRVWASKWNERAFLSRRARKVPHDHLRMAVLIQQVVPADYAFVIHTANPFTGNREELYAELVLGLGETLVGNYPGRALGFVCRKSDLMLEVLSYPGKSLGLYGKGVIFRSDSNGEDLEGFAGAGLYESVLAEEPEHRILDYRQERLVWDTAFREELLRTVAKVGLEVEKVLGTPQDIEGAVTGGRFFVVQTRPQVGQIDG